MKIVRVTYTTQPAFAEENQQNIRRVMADLRELDHSGIHYITCLAADGKTFVHTAFFETEADQQRLNEVPSFLEFQQKLKASGPETPPQQEVLSFVGASKPLFD